jgi:hypothetical protein
VGNIFGERCWYAVNEPHPTSMESVKSGVQNVPQQDLSKSQSPTCESCCLGGNAGLVSDSQIRRRDRWTSCLMAESRRWPALRGLMNVDFDLV